MVNKNCPVCKTSANNQSNLFNLQKDNHNYNVVRCTQCNHVYTFFEDDVDIQVYYDDKDYKVKDTRKTVFYKIQEREYKNVLKKIKSLSLNKSTSILDFGAGKGLFLNFAKELAFTTKGVETSLPRANYAKEFFNLEIKTDYYAAGQIFENQFDVITLLHVLEHLSDPKELLQELLSGNLNRKGITVIEVPNFDSWQSKWGAKQWIHLDIPRHINHFTPTFLKEVLIPKNFEVIKEEYFSLHLGIIGMIQSIWSWFGYSGFLISDLKDKKTPYLMFKIMLSLPFAFLFEGLASFFNKGGIVRIYARKLS